MKTHFMVTFLLTCFDRHGTILAIARTPKHVYQCPIGPMLSTNYKNRTLPGSSWGLTQVGWVDPWGTTRTSYPGASAHSAPPPGTPCARLPSRREGEYEGASGCHDDGAGTSECTAGRVWSAPEWTETGRRTSTYARLGAGTTWINRTCCTCQRDLTAFD